MRPAFQADDLRSSEQSLKALADFQSQGPVTTTGFGAAPTSGGASAAAASGATVTNGFGTATVDATAPPQPVHDLSNLVRKRKPAPADDDAAKRPKA